MVRTSTDRVRLALTDWGGLCSLALAVLTIAGATLYQIHDLSAANRARQARFESELGHLKSEVRRLQVDVRALVRRSAS